MKGIGYIHLDTSGHAGWEAVGELFSRMYVSMEELGLMLPLTEEGAEKWLRTVKNTSGKFGLVILALDENEPVGFAQGMIKFLPDYLGGHPVGMIGHVYVEEKWRRAGTGRELVRELENWFKMKNVHSVELQVISTNPAAKAFWSDLGYEQELVQYRKFKLL